MREDVEEFRARGAKVVAVAPHTPDEITAYTKRNGELPYLIVADTDHAAFDAYDVQSRMASLGQRPALFVIDATGTVRFDSVGTQQWQIPTNDEVLAAIDAM